MIYRRLLIYLRSIILLRKSSKNAKYCFRCQINTANMADIENVFINETSASARSLNACASITKYHTICNDVQTKAKQTIANPMTSNDSASLAWR